MLIFMRISGLCFYLLLPFPPSFLSSISFLLFHSRVMLSSSDELSFFFLLIFKCLYVFLRQSIAALWWLAWNTLGSPQTPSNPPASASTQLESQAGGGRLSYARLRPQWYLRWKITGYHHIIFRIPVLLQCSGSLCWPLDWGSSLSDGGFAFSQSQKALLWVLFYYCKLGIDPESPQGFPWTCPAGEGGALYQPDSI